MKRYKFLFGTIGRIIGSFVLASCNVTQPADAGPQDRGRIDLCGNSGDRCGIEPAALSENEKANFDATLVGRRKRNFDLKLFQKEFDALPRNDKQALHDVTWPQRSKASANTSVVLFIEPYQQPISALGRFRDQVLGRYRYNFENGFFDLDSTVLHVPARFENLGRLWAKYQPALNLLSDFNSAIAEYFDPKVAKPFGDQTVNYHGTFVFDLFAMRAPQANVVFAEFPSINELLACEKSDTTSAARRRIASRFDQLKTAYEKVLRASSVTDVVITHTFSASTIRSTLQSECPILERRANDVIETLVVYQRSVFAQPNLRVFQAMANDSSRLRTAQDWALHCLQGENVFRVSYLSSSRTDIPSFGQPLTSLEPPHDQRENWGSGCTQVVINSGFDEVAVESREQNDREGEPQNEDSGVFYEAIPKFNPNRQAMSAPRIGAFNEQTEHRYIMANSWATPIAAAMALHIDANFRKATGRGLSLEEMKKLLYGRVFDPILHKQFEVYFEQEGNHP